MQGTFNAFCYIYCWAPVFSLIMASAAIEHAFSLWVLFKLELISS